MSIRVRYAPSPTGLPHVGNIRSAIFNWLFARKMGGRFIVRIEDTDRARFVEGSVESILGALRWLGMDWDEGPEVGGNYGPYFQSERLPLYHKYAEWMAHEGKAYWCDCSSERLEKLREEQSAKKLPPRYDNKCRFRGLKGFLGDGKHVLRFAIPEGGKTVFHDELRGDIVVENDTLDDFVLLKADGFPTYHFANIIDDHHMAITHIMRGDEWIASGPKHKLLYDAIGAEPPKFVHLPVILAPDKSKLSKRHGATDILSYKEMGYLPEAMFNFLALIGWNPGSDKEILSREEIIEKFSIERINVSAGVFDINKLDWMNGEYLRAMAPEELAERFRPLMSEWGWMDSEFKPWGKDYVARVCALMAERIKKFPDIKELGFFFFIDPEDYDPKGVEKRFKQSGSAERLKAVNNELSKSEWTVPALEGTIRALAEKLSIPAGDLIHPIRLAVSGMTFGPGLFEMLETIGKERVLSRIDRAIKWIER